MQEVYGFEYATAQRLLQIARQTGSVDAYRPETMRPMSMFAVGKVTTAITARSGSTLGTGVVQFQEVDTTLANWSNADGDEYTETVYTLSTDGYSVDDYVLCAFDFLGGVWMVFDG